MSALPQMVQVAPQSTSLDPATLEQANALVDRLEAAITALLPCLDIERDIPPIHHFADGLYGRTMVAPAGMLLVGMVHKSEHISVVSQGTISVWSAIDGVRHYEAPHILISSPGTRRIGYTHADTIWTTFHATSATDVESAEQALLEERPKVDYTHEDIVELGRVLTDFGLELALPEPPNTQDESESVMSLDGGSE